METRICLECGATIRGRVDKKFCNDQCRNSFHNRVNSGGSVTVKQVNQILRHNRQVMRKLIPEVKGKITVNRSKLLQEGFDFTYHTHIYTTRNGHHYTFCYEYGYLPLENDVVMLVKREEEKSRE